MQKISFKDDVTQDEIYRVTFVATITLIQTFKITNKLPNKERQRFPKFFEFSLKFVFKLISIVLRTKEIGKI